MEKEEAPDREHINKMPKEWLFVIEKDIDTNTTIITIPEPRDKFILNEDEVRHLIDMLN